MGNDTLTAVATDNRGGKTTSANVVVTISSNNGIANLQGLAPIAVYPNPTEGQVSIVFGQASTNNQNVCIVYNITGQAVANKALHGIVQGQVETLDLSTLPAGVYFLELTIDGNKSVRQLMKR